MNYCKQLTIIYLNHFMKKFRIMMLAPSDAAQNIQSLADGLVKLGCNVTIEQDKYPGKERDMIAFQINIETPDNLGFEKTLELGMCIGAMDMTAQINNKKVADAAFGELIDALMATHPIPNDVKVDDDEDDDLLNAIFGGFDGKGFCMKS